MKLISDFTDVGLKTSVITESTSSAGRPVKRRYLEGVFMQAERENRNRRTYPLDVLKEAVNRFVTEQVATGRAVGELNHPDGPQINLDKVSHRIVELKWNGNDVYGKALILNTPMGLIVDGLLEGGVKLGVSSRGMGNIAEQNGRTVVKPGFIVSAIDVVQDPSAPSAFVEGIMESIDWSFDGKQFVANKVDRMNESLKKIRKTRSSEFYTEAQEREFARFLAEVASGNN